MVDPIPTFFVCTGRGWSEDAGSLEGREIGIYRGGWSIDVRG